MLFLHRKYLDNIVTVDKGIERTVEVIENFFEFDQNTAYIFTSDHGMTDWGNLRIHAFLNTSNAFLKRRRII